MAELELQITQMVVMQVPIGLRCCTMIDGGSNLANTLEPIYVHN